MCSSGGGGGDDIFGTQAAAQQAQQAAVSTAQLNEQQREFNVQQTSNDQSLANTKALQDAQAADVANQAALTNTWETGRAANQQAATGAVDQAFSAFTPDYYDGYTKAYTDHYQPQLDQQFGAVSNANVYGLARQGNLQSQTAADQIGMLDQQKGNAEADIANKAVAATADLKTNVLNAQANLTNVANSDATLGSPITPGSVDAMNADFNTTSSALARIGNTAGDTVGTLQATPTYSSLGSVFGTAASAASGAITGNNAYTNYQAFNSAANSTSGASNPNGGGSSTVK